MKISSNSFQANAANCWTKWLLDRNRMGLWRVYKRRWMQKRKHLRESLPGRNWIAILRWFISTFGRWGQFQVRMLRQGLGVRQFLQEMRGHWRVRHLHTQLLAQSSVRRRVQILLVYFGDAVGFELLPSDRARRLIWNDREGRIGRRVFDSKQRTL